MNVSHDVSPVERGVDPQVALSLTNDAKYYVTRRLLLIPNYKGFDVDDLRLPDRATGLFDPRQLLDRTEAVFADMKQFKTLRDIEQRACEAYVRVVEMARKHMAPEDASNLIESLKDLNYQFARKTAALVERCYEELDPTQID